MKYENQGFGMKIFLPSLCLSTYDTIVNCKEDFFFKNGWQKTCVEGWKPRKGVIIECPLYGLFTASWSWYHGNKWPLGRWLITIMSWPWSRTLQKNPFWSTFFRKIMTATELPWFSWFFRNLSRFYLHFLWFLHYLYLI